MKLFKLIYNNQTENGAEIYKLTRETKTKLFFEQVNGFNPYIYRVSKLTNKVRVFHPKYSFESPKVNIIKQTKMKTYKTVDDYLKEAKPNDKVIFGGKGLKNRNKANTYTVKAIKEDGTLSLRAYRGRTNLILGANAYDQQIMVVTNKEFKEMPVY